MGAINKRKIILASIIHSIIDYSKAFDKIDFTTFQIFQIDINKWKNYSKAKLTSRKLHTYGADFILREREYWKPRVTSF